MDRYELVFSALKSENYSGSLPLSLWRHFPGVDRDPEGLAREEIAFQKHFDPDLMKISPHGRYCATDFGCEIATETDPVSGSTKCRKCSINSLEDWESLEPVDVLEGDFGKQIKAAELIMKEYESTVPSMMTVFSPFMVASKIDPDLLQRIKDQDALKVVKEGLNILYKVMLDFSKASLDTGVDGLFLASQHFNTLLEEEEVRSFEIHYLQQMLNELRSRPGFFTVLHLHGYGPKFQLAADFLENYLPTGINWHDQSESPSLREANFKGGLLGGLDEQVSLRKDKPALVGEKLAKFLDKLDDRSNKIIAPGCVVPVDTLPDVYDIVIEAVRNFRF
ncbi:MAG: uroporphyrinogen decarboxylase family protein [Candidatus Odinarchaeota archaeon]